MQNKEEGEELQDFLNHKIFAGQKGEKLLPVKEDVEGFDQFMVRYKKGLAIEHAAVDALK